MKRGEEAASPGGGFGDACHDRDMWVIETWPLLLCVYVCHSLCGWTYPDDTQDCAHTESDEITRAGAASFNLGKLVLSSANDLFEFMQREISSKSRSHSSILVRKRRSTPADLMAANHAFRTKKKPEKYLKP
jgi:hypothetical protein